MANKKDRISVSTLKKCLKEITDQNIATVEWRGIKVSVKHRLSLIEALGFVDGVAKSCFPSDESEYTPEVKDFAIRCGILDTYANFALPENVEEKYDFVCAFDGYGLIMGEIDRQQFEAIIAAIDEKIEYMKQAHIEEITKQMNELYFTVEDLMQRLVGAFDGLDKDLLSEFVGMLQEGGLDEKKVVDAIFDAKAREQAEKEPESE